MNRFIKTIGITAVVSVLALAGAATALAQGATPPARGSGYGPGMIGGYGFMAQYRDAMHTQIAEALGLTLGEFNAAIAEGQTPYVIAQEKGIDLATLQTAMQQAHAAVLAQAVADGQLTQAQADWMLAHQAQMQGWHAAGNYGPMMRRGYRAGGSGYGPCHRNLATPTP